MSCSGRSTAYNTEHVRHWTMHDLSFSVALHGTTSSPTQKTQTRPSRRCESSLSSPHSTHGSFSLGKTIFFAISNGVLASRRFSLLTQSPPISTRRAKNACSSAVRMSATLAAAERTYRAYERMKFPGSVTSIHLPRISERNLTARSKRIETPLLTMIKATRAAPARPKCAPGDTR